MPKAIISDTSCLILRSNIAQLNILRDLFGTIVTTSEVAQEFGEELPAWIEIQVPLDKAYKIHY